MTDAEWALIEPHMPTQKVLGRPRKVQLREVVEALLYILRTACPWRLLPRDFPKRSSVQHYFYACQADRPLAGYRETKDATEHRGISTQSGLAISIGKAECRFVRPHRCAAKQSNDPDRRPVQQSRPDRQPVQGHPISVRDAQYRREWTKPAERAVQRDVDLRLHRSDATAGRRMRQQQPISARAALAPPRVRK